MGSLMIEPQQGYGGL